MPKTEGPFLFPVSCPLCNRFLAEVPEGSEILCCGQWWKAKSPERRQAEYEAKRQARFKTMKTKKRKG